MNVALIDMGSNSIRLAVYKVEQKDFEPIFSKRYMTGLASYVKEKQLTAAGVEQACIVLLDAKSLLEQLSVDQTTVFATASLRNIKNTEAVVAAIQQKTGYTVQILSGHEEAFLDYFGVMHGNHHLCSRWPSFHGKYARWSIAFAYRNGGKVPAERSRGCPDSRTGSAGVEENQSGQTAAL